jgi:hypothetical protein
MQRYLLPFLSFFLLASACDRVGDRKSETEVGTIALQLSDDPFPANLVSKAQVTISMIQIRGTDSLMTLSQTPHTVNLLELRNGVTASLVNKTIPVGTYDLIRLRISEAAVTMKNGTTHTLKIPSGAQTGLKVFISPPIEVVGNLTYELLLDFDVSKSFVVQGNMNTPAGIKGFIFKPVIRVQNLSSAGSLTGTVQDTSSQTLGDAQVWVEQDSIVSSTLSDTTSGHYTLLGLPVGIYTLKATLSGYDTTTVTGIQIVAANEITRNLVITPQ